MTDEIIPASAGPSDDRPQGEQLADIMRAVLKGSLGLPSRGDWHESFVHGLSSIIEPHEDQDKIYQTIRAGGTPAYVELENELLVSKTIKFPDGSGVSEPISVHDTVNMPQVLGFRVAYFLKVREVCASRGLHIPANPNIERVAEDVSKVFRGKPRLGRDWQEFIASRPPRQIEL